MTVARSIKLSDEEKLNILRRVDEFRQWHSLDEKRYCLVCGEMITGRQIRVIGDTPGNAHVRVSCPTERCNATPMEWVCPTEDVLIKIAMVEAECRLFRLVTQAGQAMQSYERSASDTTSRTKSKPRLG
jgi:hypothetical protein